MSLHASIFLLGIERSFTCASSLTTEVFKPLLLSLLREPDCLCCLQLKDKATFVDERPQATFEGEVDRYACARGEGGGGRGRGREILLVSYTWASALRRGFLTLLSSRIGTSCAGDVGGQTTLITQALASIFPRRSAVRRPIPWSSRQPRDILIAPPLVQPYAGFTLGRWAISRSWAGRACRTHARRRD